MDRFNTLQAYSATAGAYLASTMPALGAIIFNDSAFNIVPFETPVNWDVNGDSLTDFLFSSYGSGGEIERRLGFAASAYSTFSDGVSAGQSGYVYRVNGRGFVAPAGIYSARYYGENLSNVAALPEGFVIGPDMVSNDFGVLTTFRRLMTVSASTGSGYSNFVAGSFRTVNGFETAPDNTPLYIGFRFSNGQDGLYYGWASITADTTNGQLIVNNWAFDDAGSPIAVGSIPEPRTWAMMGLGLLALGASGARHWRKPRKCAGSSVSSQ